MTTSEPTTGEIVRALRDCSKTSCSECICRSIGTERPLCGAKPIADRLEAQEREIERLNAELAGDAEEQDLTTEYAILDIAALTARAEQAERDAAISAITRSCSTCANRAGVETDAFPCCICHKYDKWRGLPQDGGAE